MLKNNEIELLIKMENVIGLHSKDIFGKNKDNVVEVGTYTISYEDFISFMNLIEKCVQAKKERARKQNERNKQDVVYHRITNNITNARKNNDMKKLEKYQKQLEKHKEKMKTRQAKEYLERKGEDK